MTMNGLFSARLTRRRAARARRRRLGERCCGCARASAQLRARRHAGQFAADPDRDAGFRRRHAGRRARSRATSRRSSPPICGAPACSRRSIRPPISRRSPASTRCRAFPTGDDQRAGAGHRPRDAPARRPAQGRVPPVGRARPASSSPASNISPRRTTGGASRTSSRMRSTSGSPARRAISTPASCSSTRPGRRSAASSASRSWIRTAPMCAI